MINYAESSQSGTDSNSTVRTNTTHFEYEDGAFWEVITYVWKEKIVGEGGDAQEAHRYVLKTKVSGYSCVPDTSGFVTFSQLKEIFNGKIVEETSRLNKSEKLIETTITTTPVSQTDLTGSTREVYKILNGKQVYYKKENIDDVSNPQMISSYWTAYDKFGRELSKYYGESKSSYDYVTKYFYYPNVVNATTPAIGRHKSSIIYNSQNQPIMGQLWEYISNTDRNAGKVKKIIYGKSDFTADGGMSGPATRYKYNDMGLVTHTWGYNETPVIYAYNELGEKTDMYLFNNIPTETYWDTDTWPSDMTISSPYAEHTQWVIQPTTGLLSQKLHNGIEDYSFNYLQNSSEISSITTPNGNVQYERLNTVGADGFSRKSTVITYPSGNTVVMRKGINGKTDKVDVVRNGQTLLWEYIYNNSAADNPSMEIFPDGFKLLRDYDDYGRMVKLFLYDASNSEVYHVEYSYDAEGKVSTLAADSRTFSFKRINGQLNGFIANSATGEESYSSKIDYDDLGRIQRIYADNGYIDNKRDIFYSFNILNKVQDKLARGLDSFTHSYTYTYNESIPGLKNVNSQIFGCAYTADSAGNIRNSAYGSVSVDIFNRIVQIGRTGLHSIYLTGNVPNLENQMFTLKIDGIEASPLTRFSNGDFVYAFKNFMSTPKFYEIKAESSIDGEGTAGNDAKTMLRGSFYIPPQNEIFNYDLSGNMIGDGRWAYTWDEANRLIAITTNPSAVSAGIKNERFEYDYDWKNLKICVRHYNWDEADSSWQLSYTNKRYYDQYNLIYETTIYTSSGRLPEVKKFYYGPDATDDIYSTGGTRGLVMINLF